MSPSPHLAKKIDRFLSADHMSQFMAHFEERHEQKNLSHTILNSFSSNAVCLIEAGTGTGKSLGYLLPALLWAIETGDRVVISTHTIALQEQLITKEIPQALHIIGHEVGVSLAKGMANYLCLNKLYEATQQASLFEDETTSTIHKIQNWSSYEEKIITKSTIPFKVSQEEWKKVNADPENCMVSRCPMYGPCHFFRARKQLADSKIVVVNHHLLLHDLQRRTQTNNWEGPCVLPPYKRVIVDEAHHLEDVALDLFATVVHRFEHLAQIKPFSKEQDIVGQPSVNTLSQKNSFSCMSLLRLIYNDTALCSAENKARIVHYAEFDLFPAAKQCIKTSESFFEAVYIYAKKMSLPHSSLASHHIESIDDKIKGEGRIRIKPEHIQDMLFSKIHEKWQEHLFSYTALHTSWNNFLSLIKDSGFAIASTMSSSHDAALSSFSSSSLSQKASSLQDIIKETICQLKAIKEKIDTHIESIHLFFEKIHDIEKVTWIEWKKSIHIGAVDISIRISSFDVGPLLRKNLFDPMATTILLSATLSAKENFDFTKRRLGLTFFEKQTNGTLIEAIYPSPFSYKENALLAVVEDMPQVKTSPAYYLMLENILFSIAQASNGGVLILFTSYSLLEAIYSNLAIRLQQITLRPMKQGEISRNQLLHNFRSSHNSVLCATDSFWEGVDIPGEALRCVVITKLPFEVPTEPLLQARSEAMIRQGLSPFYHHTLPKAIVKFKQAFGRLIRRSTDYGVVVSLDSRITNKGYGIEFLKSIPSCSVWQGKHKDLFYQIEQKLQQHRLP